jgi:hypothetical protein
VVYETITEGGISRFNCIFQSVLPEDVGPVRSARNSDLSIVPEYDALFFYSGTNPVVVDQMAGTNIANMVNAGIYHRVDFREAPHNLYCYLQGAYAESEAQGHAVVLAEPRTLEFQVVEPEVTPASGSGAGAGASGTASGTASTSSGTASNATTPAATPPPPENPSTPASAVTVPFSDSFIAEWAWDANAKEGTGAWLRSMDGPTLDAANDQQVAVQNVIVLWGVYTPDNAGGTTLEISLAGENAASLFLEGKRIDGTWHTDGTTPPRFKDANGNAILLAPGQTWIHVLNEGMEISVN